MGSPLFSLILSVGTDISYGCRLSLKARLRQRWSVAIPLVCVILQVSFSYLILADLNKNVKSKKIFAHQDLGKESPHRKKNYLYTGEYPQVIHRHAHGSRGPRDFYAGKCIKILLVILLFQ